MNILEEIQKLISGRPTDKDISDMIIRSYQNSYRYLTDKVNCLQDENSKLKDKLAEASLFLDTTKGIHEYLTTVAKPN